MTGVQTCALPILSKIAKQIADSGFNAPIVINNDNTILDGSAIFEAAKQLGMKQVPCTLDDSYSLDVDFDASELDLDVGELDL